MNHAAAATPSQRRSRFANYRWIPWVFVAALAFVFAVNGGLIYFASVSWPGLTTDHAYNEGLEYNRVIDESAIEAKLGWKVDVTFAPRTAAHGGALVIVAHDAAGVALDNIAWRGELVRPVGEEAALPVKFVSQGDGRYTVAIDPPRAGQWNLYLTAKRGETQWHGGQRFVVPVP